MTVRLLCLITFLCLIQHVRAADYAWEPIGWQEGEIVKGEGKVKLALTIPVRINGNACIAQLDTGANGSVTWHGDGDANAARSPMVIEALGKTMPASGPTSVLTYISGGKCTDGVIASLGNGFFEDGTLLLDLQKNRVAFTPKSVLVNASNAQPFTYTRWAQSGAAGGHVIVGMQMPSGRTAEAMFDTGAASFGVSAFSAEHWAELTSHTPLVASDIVSEYSVGMWGKPIRCFRMNAPGTVVLAGNMSVKQFHASYCMQDAFKPGQKLVGLLGMRHFMGKFITLDYLSQRWTVEP